MYTLETLIGCVWRYWATLTNYDRASAEALARDHESIYGRPFRVRSASEQSEGRARARR